MQEAKPKIRERMTRARRAENVAAFREEIDRWFVRYQTLYDRTNFSLRQYRLQHVDLVSTIYNALMRSLGDGIEEVRQAAYELDDLIQDRRAQGGNNACIQDVSNTRDANNARVNGLIQDCATYANTTLSGMLANVFYPTFAIIQTEASRIPISVIDVLSKGNVLEDEQDILRYLGDRYQAIEMQWFATVSQLLRWDTSRFNVEGLFLADQTAICMGDATWQYLLTNSLLEGEIQQC